MDEQQPTAVDIVEVLKVTQARLQAITEQAIMLEVLVNQRSVEIEELQKRLEELGGNDNGKAS